MSEEHCVSCGLKVEPLDPEENSKIQQISSLSRICHACWQRADRAAVRSIQEPALTSSARSSAATNEDEIILPNYTRAANTQSRCIFTDCRSKERIHIPNSIRLRLLCDLSFYVPQNCRICNFHLRKRTWDSLIVKNGNHTFTAVYIEDLLSLLKSQMGNNIDFEDIEESDDHLVYYWLGMSKEQFIRMLDRVPRLKSTHRGATGLAAYLTILNTGDSDDRLSALFKIPRSTLVRLIKVAKELLPPDFEQLMD